MISVFLGWLVTLGLTVGPVAGVGWSTDALVASPARELPACRYDERVIRLGRNGDPWLVLVDTARRLPRGYAPRDLRSTAGLPLQGETLLRKAVIPDLRRLAIAARRAGSPLAVRTGYRSEAFQRAIFRGWVREEGLDRALRSSARPGHSEHQLGTSLDLASPQGRAPWDHEDWGRTRAGSWLRENAWRFGFVMSYPPGAEDVTCYRYESWHFRHVGRDVARALRATGLTLREYLWYRSTGNAAD